MNAKQYINGWMRKASICLTIQQHLESNGFHRTSNALQMYCFVELNMDAFNECCLKPRSTWLV